MFKDIVVKNPSHIEDFICIDGLELKNLTNINIFVGKNGVGKTTLLGYLDSVVPFTDTQSYFGIGDIKSHLPLTKDPSMITYDDSVETIFVFIDEIENGLDVKNLKLCADNIITICKERVNYQFFIVTHSLEFLDILDKVSAEKEFRDIAVYNISMTSRRGIQAYRYDMDGVRNMIENDTEFRY